MEAEYTSTDVEKYCLTVLLSYWTTTVLKLLKKFICLNHSSHSCNTLNSDFSTEQVYMGSIIRKTECKTVPTAVYHLKECMLNNQINNELAVLFHSSI